MICGFQAEYEKEEEKLEVDIQKSRNLLTKHQTELNMKHKQMVTIIGVWIDTYVFYQSVLQKKTWIWSLCVRKDVTS